MTKENENSILNNEKYRCLCLANSLKDNTKLLAFLKKIFGEQNLKDKFRISEEEDLEYKNISTEVKVNKNCRIDIVIDIYKKIWLPIEAKIHAKERENQCEDYLEISCEYNQKNAAKICYLTIDGKKSDKGSTDVIPIKWDVLEDINNDTKLNIDKWVMIQDSIKNEIENVDISSPWNILKNIENETYLRICFDDYPLVKIGTVEYNKSDKNPYKNAIWYKEINIEDKNLKTECKKWLNQKVD